MSALPFVDDHVLTVPRAPGAVHAAIDGYVRRTWVRARRRPVEHLLGTGDPGGFHITESVPGRLLVLEGRHRFSRYRLAFRLEPDGDGTRVTARTEAAFPGPHGAVYRALVVGTRLHVVATRRILQQAVAAD